MGRTEDDQPPSDDPGLPAELARAIDDGHAAADLDGLYRALHADIARERGLRGWLRERSTAARLLAASGVIAGVCVLVAVAFARSDLGAYPIERFVLSLSAMGLLLVVSLVIALRPLQRPGLPTWVSPAVVACSLLALAGLYLVILPSASGIVPALRGGASIPAAPDLASLTPALVCLAIGLALGAPVYALIVLLERGGPRRALPMAAAAGLAANLVLHIHCPRTQLTHLMLGHFGAAALLLLAVALWTRARD